MRPVSRRWPGGLMRREDGGFTVLAVMGTMTVLMLFLMVAVASVVHGMALSRQDQDAKSSVAAAYAGIDEFLARLNANPNYYVNAAPDAGTSGRPVDSNNAALVHPLIASTPGVIVPGGGAATFRYQLLTPATETALRGYIRLRSTGTSKGVSRTLTARLQPKGLLDHLYFSDREVIDPSLNGNNVRVRVNGAASAVDPATGATMEFYAAPREVSAVCSQSYGGGRHTNSYTSGTDKPYWVYNPGTSASGDETFRPNQTVAEITPNNGSFCSDIRWVTGDVVNGPLHTNDALLIDGNPVFTGSATTAWQTTDPPAHTKNWRGSGTPSGSVTVVDNKPLPKSNTELLQQARDNGCVYSGQTRLKFTGDGKMTVLSPSTPTGSSAPRAGCLPTNPGEAVNVPPVIYVQPVSSCAANPDIGFPAADEEFQHGITTTYNCTNGTVFVEGSLRGQATVAAANDIVITGDLTYANDVVSTPDTIEGTDVLGLVAANSVWVYHPVHRNAARGKTVTTSSNGADGAKAIDGDLRTKWSSAATDGEWLVLDFGTRYRVDGLTIDWDMDYGKAYNVQVSPDSSNWTTIRSVTNGDGGRDDLTGLYGVGRYLRIQGVTRSNTARGYSIKELRVSGAPKAASTTDIAFNKPSWASSVEGTGLEAWQAFDGNSATRWSSSFADNQWISVDLGREHRIDGLRLDWEAAFGRVYDVQLSNDAQNWWVARRVNDGDGGIDDITGLSQTARYVRIYGYQRGTPYGFSLFTVSVYGSLPETNPGGGPVLNLLSTPVTRIDAVLVSLQHSVLVQNWGTGPKITTGESTKLNIRGAIVQRFRGPVGTGTVDSATTGYLKKYDYDERLERLFPPYFLQMETSPWQVALVTDN